MASSRRFTLPTALREDPRCHQWLLRLVQRRGLEQMAAEPRYLNDEVLAAIGLRRLPKRNPPTFADLRARVQDQLDALRGAEARGVIVDNARRLQRLANLRHLDTDLIVALFHLGDDDVFESVVGYSVDAAAVERSLATMLARRRAEVRTALGPGAPLQRQGIVVPGKGRDPVELNERLQTMLCTPFGSDEAFLAALAPSAPRSRLRREDFVAQKDAITVALTLLDLHASSSSSTTMGRRRGVRAPQILLHGPPGTGKTELARLLLREAGQQAFEVTVVDEGLEPASRQTRLNHYALCQRLMQPCRSGADVTPGPRPALIFDEAEDVFPRDEGESSVRDKGFFTRLLDQATVPTVWITNAAGAVDEAILRRFALILEVNTPPTAQRAALVSRGAKKLKLPTRLTEQLVAHDGLQPAMLQHLVDVGAAMARAEPRRVTASGRRRASSDRPTTSNVDPARAIEVVAEGFLRVTQAPNRRQLTTLTGREGLPFDDRLLNATPSIAHLASTLREGGRGLGASVLLSGPPGTGKTAFARALATSLGRPLLERVGSDILSRWVGEAEQRIAGMFTEATASGAVVFLDEVDTFLSARSSSAPAWQLSQTNELLVRMADFDGVLVCATNMPDALDPAVFRRFDLKVTLGPLTEAGRVEALRVAFAPLLSAGALSVVLAAAPSLGGLCVGDVVAARRGLRFAGRATSDAPTDAEVAAVVLDGLREDLRRRQQRRPIGFGA